MKTRFIVVHLWLGYLMTNSYAGISQSFMVAYGPAYTTTKQVTPVVNGQNAKGTANTTYVFALSYEQFLAKTPFSFIATYSRFDGYTFVYFEKGGVFQDGGELIAAGYNGTKIRRYDAGITYNFLEKKRKVYFSPNISCGIQHSVPNGYDIYPFNIIGPNYVETSPTSAETFNTLQLVPSIGFRVGFVFWKRLDIGLSFQGVLGYKPYQKMYLEYKYKGVPQKTGEFEANGTGLFVTLGIGYRFAKLIK